MGPICPCLLGCLLIFCLGIGICWSAVLPVPTSSTICVYNGVTYNGTFHPSPCYYCHCTSGKPVCAIMDCAFPACAHTVTKPGHCCPVCTTGTCILTFFLVIILFLQTFSSFFFVFFIFFFFLFFICIFLLLLLLLLLLLRLFKYDLNHTVVYNVEYKH